MYTCVFLGCLELQVSFRKRATNYKALLRKMTQEDLTMYTCVFLITYTLLIIHVKPMKKKMKRGKRVIRIKKSDQGASQSVAVAERCSVLQCVAVCFNVLQYVAVCCSMLQCALQHTATHCNTLHYTATHCNTWRQVTSSLSLACTRVAVCCGVLRCVAVCCTDVRRGRWRKKEASSASHKVNNSLSRMYLKIYIYS